MAGSVAEEIRTGTQGKINNAMNVSENPTNANGAGRGMAALDAANNNNGITIHENHDAAASGVPASNAAYDDSQAGKVENKKEAPFHWGDLADDDKFKITDGDIIDFLMKEVILHATEWAMNKVAGFAGVLVYEATNCVWRRVVRPAGRLAKGLAFMPFRLAGKGIKSLYNRVKNWRKKDDDDNSSAGGDNGNNTQRNTGGPYNNQNSYRQSQSQFDKKWYDSQGGRQGWDNFDRVMYDNWLKTEGRRHRIGFLCDVLNHNNGGKDEWKDEWARKSKTEQLTIGFALHKFVLKDNRLYCPENGKFASDEMSETTIDGMRIYREYQENRIAEKMCDKLNVDKNSKEGAAIIEYNRQMLNRIDEGKEESRIPVPEILRGKFDEAKLNAAHQNAYMEVEKLVVEDIRIKNNAEKADHEISKLEREQLWDIYGQYLLIEHHRQHPDDDCYTQEEKLQKFNAILQAKAKKKICEYLQKNGKDVNVSAMLDKMVEMRNLAGDRQVNGDPTPVPDWFLEMSKSGKIPEDMRTVAQKNNQNQEAYRRSNSYYKRQEDGFKAKQSRIDKLRGLVRKWKKSDRKTQGGANNNGYRNQKNKGWDRR